MNNGTLVHYGYLQKTELNMVSNYAKAYGLQFVHEGIKKLSIRNPKLPNRSFRNFVQTSKYSNFVVIWNGKQCFGPLVTEMCEKKNIPKCYMEWGMLPQSEHFFIDPKGFCGSSILKNDLSWITNIDMDNMYKRRIELQNIYSIQNNGYILVPFQMENDSQVVFYSKYKNMYDFILDVINMFPNEKILIKLHPKSTKTYLTLWQKNINTLIKINPNISIANINSNFMNLASKALFIVGITSTTLYEAGVLGKKVISLGDHPLNTQQDDIDKILAGAFALNLNRQTGDLKSILDKFNIKPL